MAHAAKRPEPAMMQMLRDAIQADGRSQNQIAKACGLDNSRLSRFVRQERDITFETACRLFDVLGITINVPPTVKDSPAEPSSRKAVKTDGKRAKAK
jgi:transcriptional regulator with XRE-family HTH domain